MANRNYIILEDKDGKEVLPVTDGNGVFVEGGTKKLESKLTEIDSKTAELNEQLETLKLNNVNIIVTDSPPPIEERVLKTFYFKVTDTQSIGQSNCNIVKVSPNTGIKIL